MSNSKHKMSPLIRPWIKIYMKTPLKSNLINYTNCLKISTQYLKYLAHQPLHKKTFWGPFAQACFKSSFILSIINLNHFAHLLFRQTLCKKYEFLLFDLLEFIFLKKIQVSLYQQEGLSLDSITDTITNTPSNREVKDFDQRVITY